MPNLNSQIDSDLVSSLTLEQCRDKIDQIDLDLLRLLSERFRYVEQVGRIKKRAGMTLLQSTRWQTVVQNVLKSAQDRGLDSSFTENVWDLIHRHALALEEKQHIS